MDWPLNYIAAWCLFCAVGAGVLVWRWRELEWFTPAYWRFVLAPWRVAFFVAAWIGIVALAPHTGDPTWDSIDASFMAILAYTTAPGSVAILYRAARRWRPSIHVAAALAVGLFSASWSYDIYLYWRDGLYPATWGANLFASSFLYVMAGGFWSLDWQPGQRRANLAFIHRESWPPTPAPGGFKAVMKIAWIILLPIVLFFVAFPLMHYFDIVL